MKTIIFKILMIVTLAASLNALGQSKVKNKNSKSPETQAQPLVGTWKLIEFSNLDTVTNVWKHVYGRNPKGYISYSRTNIVNINVSSEHPLQIPKDSSATYSINLARYARAYAFGYFGTYSVDKEKAMVTHLVTGGTIPDYIGTDQTIPFTIKADTLIIGDIKRWRRIFIKVD
jgi:hypothetical protein